MSLIAGIRWEQLFGRTDRFAVRLGLANDTAQPSLGRMELHVNGICLTRNQHGIIGFDAGVTWDLLDDLRWLTDNLPSIGRGDELPFTLRGTPTAAEWLVRSLEPTAALTDQQQHDWFRRRTSYWSAHSMASMGGAAIPDIVLRRVLNDVEISWTTRLGTVRSDIRWLEAEGAVRLPIADVPAGRA